MLVEKEDKPVWKLIAYSKYPSNISQPLQWEMLQKEPKAETHIHKYVKKMIYTLVKCTIVYISTPENVENSHMSLTIKVIL